MPDLPLTRQSLATELRTLGVRPDMTVLLHSSLSSLGWVCGGAVAVVQAMLDVLGDQGTLVVPAQTMGNSDPRLWTRPPVPRSWWPVIRERLPAFDPAITPSIGLGVLAEQVRTWPGAVRSDHPHASFAAVGHTAAELLAEHQLDSQLGDHSPLGALERAGARVLLLGVGYHACTAFHLGEYRVPHPVTRQWSGAARDRDGVRQWITYTDVATNSDDFAELGAAFEATGEPVAGRIGDADCRLFTVAGAAAFATGWLAANRAPDQARP